MRKNNLFPPSQWVAARRAKNMFDSVKNKAKQIVAGVVAVGSVASAQTTGGDVASVVATAAATAQSDFVAIIGSVSPVAFIVVTAIVSIGLGIKLFRKAG
jgi:hypothetical protein